VLKLAQPMPFAAVARTVDESWHRVNPVCKRYVHLAIAATDLSETTNVTIDETSYEKCHRYLMLVADADARKVCPSAKHAGAANIGGFAQHLRNHNGAADNITSAAIDMSKAFIKRVTENLPKAVITFDRFHVVAHASQAVDKMRRIEGRPGAMAEKTFPLLFDSVGWGQTKTGATILQLGIGQTILAFAMPTNAPPTSVSRCWR
jgi:transposase